MFSKNVYMQRRKILCDQLEAGVIFLPGNEEVPMNYASNGYHFRQDSTFLYYFGLDAVGLAGMIDVESGESILFGDELDLTDIIWMGPQRPLSEQSKDSGIDRVEPAKSFRSHLDNCVKGHRKVHYIPPYREKITSAISTLLNISRADVAKNSSEELIAAVISQRSYKSSEEIAEIEKAHIVSYNMHTTAMRMAKPGIYEREIAGKIEGIALSAGGNLAFPVILSIRGEILHNHYHGNILKDGDLIINDSGAENEMHYATDITRTFPVNGKYTPVQKDIYQIVLRAETEAIEAIKPGIKYRDIHLKSAYTIASGLKDLGLMKGNLDDAVQAGAHALFFPHGLGHMMGLDVHDMENLGEDLVGYDATTQRSDQFGLAYLRLGKELESGFVLTVEPGIYFIPALISEWKKAHKNEEFIAFAQVEKYLNFGGIRIEDDVIITATGSRLVGQPIPKTIEAVEEMCQHGN
jgi:Xaa-Pro aminopeptidase